MSLDPARNSKNNAQVRLLECGTAARFLQTVCSVTEARDNLDRSLLFRGVGDAAYQLRPTALRPDGQEKLQKIRMLEAFDSKVDGPHEMSSAFQQAFAEQVAVSRFYRLANEQGLPLPPVSQRMHHALLRRPTEVDPNRRTTGVVE